MRMWFMRKAEEEENEDRIAIVRRLKTRTELTREAFNLTTVANRPGTNQLNDVFHSLDTENGLPKTDGNATGVPKVESDIAARPSQIDRDWAVRYRLAVSNVFVEKAQLALEHRAKNYALLGSILYFCALVAFVTGAYIAVDRFLDTTKASDSSRGADAERAVPTASAIADKSNAEGDGTTWIGLVKGFLLALTAYGFIVLTAVAFGRVARACLDQRERLLAKRHSLRQGRLYLQMKGGNITIEEMDRAFNWNHEQFNAFTHMATDAQAPMGHVIQEIIKIVPDLVKTGVSAARDTTEKKASASANTAGH